MPTGSHKCIIDWNEFDRLVDNGINLKQIAKHFNLSSKYFSKLAFEHLGQYPSVYIAKRRQKFYGSTAHNMPTR